MVRQNDVIEITGYNYQGLIPIGEKITVERVIPDFNAVEHFVDGKISIWILPEDYKIVGETH